jgi:hypothetical protein
VNWASPHARTVVSPSLSALVYVLVSAAEVDPLIDAVKHVTNYEVTA